MRDHDDAETLPLAELKPPGADAAAATPRAATTTTVSSGPTPDRSTVLDDLERRIATLEGEAPKTEQRWHTRLGTLAGISGLLLSLILAGRAAYNETQADRWRRQHELTEVVSKLVDLNMRSAEMSVKLSTIAPGSGGPGMDQTREIMRPLANQRFILLEEAKRIVDTLGEEAPVLELSVLAESYTSQLDYTTAEAYLKKVAEQSPDPAVAASGWRSLGSLAFIKGPAFRSDARAHFQRAADLLANRSDLGSLLFSLDIFQVWAETELAHGEVREAVEKTARAMLTCRALPCVPIRTACLAWGTKLLEQATLVDGLAPMLSREAVDRVARNGAQARQCGDGLDQLVARAQ